jgi:NAD(P)H-quinone oxidoreductase subunit 4
MVGTGLTAVYFLLLVNRAFFGRLTEELSNLPPVQWLERIPALLVAGFVLGFGIQPNWLLRWSEATARHLIISTPVLAQRVPQAIRAENEIPTSATLETPPLKF